MILSVVNAGKTVDFMEMRERHPFVFGVLRYSIPPDRRGSGMDAIRTTDCQAGSFHGKLALR